MNALSYQPLTLKNWIAFEELFGEKGACGGCWCMLWRLTRQTFEAGKGAGNKAAIHDLVAQNYSPGILVFDEDRAIAWCSVSSRDDFHYFKTTRTLKPVDEQAVWSISCLFIHKAYRRKGVSRFLLQCVEEFVKAQGGSILEAYPSIPKKDKMPDVFAWTGLVPIFERCGFELVAKRGARQIMRKFIQA